MNTPRVIDHRRCEPNLDGMFISMEKQKIQTLVLIWPPFDPWLGLSLIYMFEAITYAHFRPSVFFLEKMHEKILLFDTELPNVFFFSNF